MANRRLLVSSQLAKDTRICSINRLKRSLRKLLPKNPGMFGFGRSQAQFSRFNEVKKLINRLPTWDEIELYGGKILRGDIQKDFRSNLPGRDKVKAMIVLIPRHRFWGRLHPSLFLYQSRSPSLFRYRWIQVRRTDELVKIQLAGSQTITEVKLYNISRLCYGSANQSYYKI